MSATFDFLSVRKKNKDEENAFYRFNEKLELICRNLPFEICNSLYDFLPDFSPRKRTFAVWCDEFFSEDNDVINREVQVRYILAQVDDIERTIKSMLDMLPVLYSNERVTKDYEKELTSLKQTCLRLKNNRNNYKVLAQIFTTQFKNTVEILYPNLKEFYEKPYDAEE